MSALNGLAQFAAVLVFGWMAGCTPDSGTGANDTVVDIPQADAAAQADGAADGADGGMPAGDGATPPPADDAGPGGMTDMGNPSAADADVPAPDMGAPMPVGSCDDFGLPTRPFVADGPAAPVFGERVGDFTLQTLDGPWRFSEQWLGCESYVFLNYFPDLRANGSGAWFGDALWNTSLDELVQKGPRNVHYFFASFEGDAEARRQRVQAVRTRVNQMLNRLVPDDAERARWAAHFHYVTDPLRNLDGPLGGAFNSYMEFLFDEASLVDLGDRGMMQPPLPFSFGIRRDQTLDAGGSLSPVVGQPSIWGMTAYFGHFYNHLANVQDQVANQEATVVSLMDEEVTDRVFTREVILPDAATMTGFDTLEFDLAITCPHRNPFACSEWDRNARISLCRTPTCNKRWEVVRWITPYWRRGERRWIIDASPFLSLLEDGGAHSFHIEMGPSWERGTSRYSKMDIRLSQRGGARSLLVKRAYTGGNFGANYNAERDPYEVMAPDDATRAELVVILSGHGQTDGDNCAEWCDHRHQFTINGTALPEITSMQAIGTLRGCAERADEGVSPGQWGNWAPSRAYWCPGLPVDAIRIDITEQVMAGAVNEVTYSASLAGEEPRGGNIDLSAYVVWYRD